MPWCAPSRGRRASSTTSCAGPAGDPFSGRSYDVYVRNGHTGPYLLSLDNLILHVNRDAEPADWEGFGDLPAPAAGEGV